MLSFAHLRRCESKSKGSCWSSGSASKNRGCRSPTDSEQAWGLRSWLTTKTEGWSHNLGGTTENTSWKQVSSLTERCAACLWDLKGLSFREWISRCISRCYIGSKKGWLHLDRDWRRCYDRCCDLRSFHLFFNIFFFILCLIILFDLFFNSLLLLLVCYLRIARFNGWWWNSESLDLQEPRAHNHDPNDDHLLSWLIALSRSIYVLIRLWLWPHVVL